MSVVLLCGISTQGVRGWNVIVGKIWRRQCGLNLQLLFRDGCSWRRRWSHSGSYCLCHCCRAGSSSKCCPCSERSPGCNSCSTTDCIEGEGGDTSPQRLASHCCTTCHTSGSSLSRPKPCCSCGSQASASTTCCSHSNFCSCGCSCQCSFSTRCRGQSIGADCRSLWNRSSSGCGQELVCLIEQIIGFIQDLVRFFRTFVDTVGSSALGILALALLKRLLV
mmetsp:Transcript_49533/g.115900  ORF Transcript_49533/g.115900 Transcript_49533/m.115900 type:complete len:221 (-) Transcript_49533:255-917(-)